MNMYLRKLVKLLADMLSSNIVQNSLRAVKTLNKYMIN